MGQKVHPEAMRVGYIHDWKSNWFSEKNFSDFLIEDVRIRDHITNKLAHAGLSDITIRKDAAEVEVNIHTARPGIVIGKSGSEVDALRRDLHRMTGKAIKVNILEIKRPELDAKLVAQSIAEQLVNRVAFRRAMKRALTSAMRSGAKGCKIQVSGRLGGAEMARTEMYNDGRVPLHTLRADIDYGFYEARTTFGRIGVKCWINKGEIMPAGYTGQDLTSLELPDPTAPIPSWSRPMNTLVTAPRRTQDPPLSVPLRLAAAWASVMFLYVYVDILAFYRPGVIDDILAGRVWEFEISQAWATGALALMAVPILMVFLSLALPARANRTTNIVVAAVYVVISLGNMLGESWVYYFGLGAAHPYRRGRPGRSLRVERAGKRHRGWASGSDPKASK
jgi:small subunit ribosomal protein S3